MMLIKGASSLCKIRQSLNCIWNSQLFYIYRRRSFNLWNRPDFREFRMDRYPYCMGSNCGCRHIILLHGSRKVEKVCLGDIIKKQSQFFAVTVFLSETYSFYFFCLYIGGEKLSRSYIIYLTIRLNNTIINSSYGLFATSTRRSDKFSPSNLQIRLIIQVK